jgi:hypothetical protein
MRRTIILPRERWRRCSRGSPQPPPYVRRFRPARRFALETACRRRGELRQRPSGSEPSDPPRPSLCLLRGRKRPIERQTRVRPEMIEGRPSLHLSLKSWPLRRYSHCAVLSRRPEPCHR